MEKAYKEIIETIGEDVEREGLLRTPARAAKAFRELTSGYEQDPEEILGVTFKNENVGGSVTVKDIEFYSLCEHHMLPIIGKVDIEYVPREKVVGLSKLSRLVEVYARRLQIQERMTAQIADAIMKYTDAESVNVRVSGFHLCMAARGIQKQKATMITTAQRTR
jgi:GTP cyclohydrolase I